MTAQSENFMELLSQAKIRTARNIFTKNKDATILDFVHAYNVQNDFNQIPHVVGSHIDHSPGGQSFENRISVVHKHSMVMVGGVVYSQMNILGPLLIGSLVLKLIIIGLSVYICDEE